MVDCKGNVERNKQLRELYRKAQPDFLRAYEKVFGQKVSCLHTFGIISEQDYDADNGILIILRELNDWPPAPDDSFFGFVDAIITKGHHINDGRTTFGRVSMLTWYNLGRWLTAIQNPEKSPEEIAAMFDTSLPALKTAAYTNINKITGYAWSDKRYYWLTEDENGIALQTLKKEIEILNPKIILCGNTRWQLEKIYSGDISNLENQGTKVLDMPHPAARKKKIEMIESLRAQL